MPALRPARFRSTATPPSRMAASKADASRGKISVAQSAPSITALTSLPTARAAARPSKAIRRFESVPKASSTRSRGKIPSPSALFSPMAKRRWVLAIMVVRSGET